MSSRRLAIRQPEDFKLSASAKKKIATLAHSQRFTERPKPLALGSRGAYCP